MGTCGFSYHEGEDAPLRRLPFEAAVDVAPIADQDHDASLHTVKVLLQQLKDTSLKQLNKKLAQIFLLAYGLIDK